MGRPGERMLRGALTAGRWAERGSLGRKLAKLFWLKNRVLYACDIRPGAKIDPTCEFYHSGLGCVIHAKAVVGPRCVFMQHVTVGSAWRGGVFPDGDRYQVPLVGSDVFFGAGCVVVGDIEIGDGAVIGANAVVTRSVPAGCTVAGVPAKIVKGPGY